MNRFRSFAIASLVGASLLFTVPASFAAAQFDTVKARPIFTAVALGGTVIPSKEVTLSAQLPGRIKTIAGEEGDEFDADTVLVAIDDAELLAQHRAAWGEYMNAQTQVRNAGMQYTRELYSPDSISKAPGGMGLPKMFDEMFTEPMSDMALDSDSDLDRRANLLNANTQFQQARNQVLMTQSKLEALDAKIRDAKSLAPFDGVIVNKFVEIGDTVQPGMPLVKFADTKQLQIQIEVPARMIPGLREGMVLSAKLDVGGWGKVRVAQIFPIADARRHTVTVKFDLPPGTPTYPGQYAHVEIQDVTAQPRYVPVIPTSALVQRGSLPGVYVKKDDGTELRLVRIGKIYPNEVTILSGLEAGDQVQTNPKGDAYLGFTGSRNR